VIKMGRIIYFGEDLVWCEILAKALRGLADVVATELIREGAPADLIVLDLVHLEKLSRLAQQGYKVVVAGIAPEWKDVRKAFLEGAVNFIEKEYVRRDIRKTFEKIFAQTGLGS